MISCFLMAKKNATKNHSKIIKMIGYRPKIITMRQNSIKNHTINIINLLNILKVEVITIE